MFLSFTLSRLFSPVGEHTCCNLFSLSLCLGSARMGVILLSTFLRLVRQQEIVI